MQPTTNNANLGQPVQGAAPIISATGAQPPPSVAPRGTNAPSHNQVQEEMSRPLRILKGIGSSLGSWVKGVVSVIWNMFLIGLFSVLLTPPGAALVEKIATTISEVIKEKYNKLGVKDPNKQSPESSADLIVEGVPPGQGQGGVQASGAPQVQQQASPKQKIAPEYSSMQKNLDDMTALLNKDLDDDEDDQISP